LSGVGLALVAHHARYTAFNALELVSGLLNHTLDALFIAAHHVANDTTKHRAQQHGTPRTVVIVLIGTTPFARPRCHHNDRLLFHKKYMTRQINTHAALENLTR
jgi:hypothetical protein